MLYLKTLHIENLFQYREFDIAFAPGVNLILGPNGSGKTNLLNCLYFALTGDLPSKKADCIHQGGGNSFLVELHCEINGNPILIRRSHKQHSLIIGDKSIEGATQVNDVLGQMLGVDVSLLEKLIFLSSTRLRGLIDCSGKERLEFFQSLLPIKSMQKLWNDIGHWVSIKQAELSQDYTSECNEYTKIQTELSLYEPVRSTQEIEEEIKQLNNYKEANDQHEQTFRELEQTLQRYQQTQEKIEQLMRQNQPIDPELEELANFYDQLIQLQKQTLDVLKQWSDRPPPKRGPDSQEIEEAKIRLGVLKQHAQQLQQFLELLEESDECPVCHSHIDSAKLAEKYRSDLAQTAAEIRRQEHYVSGLEQQKQEADKNTKLRADIRKELEIVRQQHKRNLKLKLRDIDFDALKKYITERQQARKTDREIQQLLQSQAYQKGLIESYQRRLAELKDKIATLQPKRLDNKPYNTNEVNSLIAKLQQELKLAKKVEEYKLRLSMLQRYVQLHHQIKDKRQRLEIIKQVRAIFHTDGAPKLLIKRFLNALNTSINQILDIFGTNYIAAFLEDGSCKIHYHTGAQFSEKQLSYGEQLMLALAIYIALGSIHRSLKLLILDEPTIGLDDDHVERVPSVLLNLLKDTGMQIICATHEKKLLRAANQVVELQTPITSS